jgi:predicted kinase
VGRYGLAMTRLVLINGAPGSGKSTIAHALALEKSMTLALDIDGIKHSLGRWDEDPLASGLHARRLTLALASEQLRAGFDVVISQYLARSPFIGDLERLAERHGAQFYEFVLDLDAAVLARRLAERASNPDRLEHAVNNRLVGPEDADALVQTIEPLRQRRPRACWVDAAGSLSSTLDILRAALPAPTP